MTEIREVKIRSGTDLNTLIYETSRFDVAEAINGPAAGSFLVDVTRLPNSTPGDQQVIQHVVNKATGVESTRALSSGVWTSWSSTGGGGGGGGVSPYIYHQTGSVTNVTDGNIVEVTYAQKAYIYSQNWPTASKSGYEAGTDYLLAPVSGMYAFSVMADSSIDANQTVSMYLGQNLWQLTGPHAGPACFIGYAAAGSPIFLDYYNGTGVTVVSFNIEWSVTLISEDAGGDVSTDYPGF